MIVFGWCRNAIETAGDNRVHQSTRVGSVLKLRIFLAYPVTRDVRQ